MVSKTFSAIVYSFHKRPSEQNQYINKKILIPINLTELHLFNTLKSKKVKIMLAQGNLLEFRGRIFLFFCNLIVTSTISMEKTYTSNVEFFILN